MSSANHHILKFLSTLSFSSLPPPVVHEAKRALLDILCCILAGRDTPIGKQIESFAAGFPHPEGASVIGGKSGISPLLAAMANGYLANALDLDDGHRASLLHAGGVIFPAAFAAAEQHDCAGEKFIESVVAGYEIGLRAGIALNSGAVYYGSAHGGAYGAAVAAGKILGLTDKQLVCALGITETQAPHCSLMGWINSRKIPMIKEGMGWAASTGMTAAMMAAGNITGTLTLFEPHPDIIATLGTNFEIEKRYYKPYPCCRWSHAPLDNLFSLAGKHPIFPAQITTVDVHTFEKAVKLNQAKPATIEDAQYSIPFIMATALVDGEFGPEQMRPEKLTDPDILHVAKKINLFADPVLEAEYPERVRARVTVTATDGSRYEQTNEHVRGDWQMPMTDADLAEKFHAFTQNVIPMENVDAIIHRVPRFENEPDVKTFIRDIR